MLSSSLASAPPSASSPALPSVLSPEFASALESTLSSVPDSAFASASASASPTSTALCCILLPVAVAARAACCCELDAKKWLLADVSMGSLALPLLSLTSAFSALESGLQRPPGCTLCDFDLGGAGSHSKKQNLCVSISCTWVAVTTLSPASCMQRLSHLGV